MDPVEPTRTDAGPPSIGTTTGGLTGWLGVAAGPEPERVAGYHIEGKLGQGGMGVVFKAVHPDLKRPAAVKRLLAGLHAADRDRVRFLAEAEAMAAVRHPHVVTVYDFGTDAGQPYLAMEYLAGGTLNSRLEAVGKLPPAEAADLLAQIADGVQAAHDQGIVHRDLKPGNILLDDAGQPKVTDFGLAKRGDSGDTASHAIMGTVGYMAPEQARGQTKRAGPAADVYALGAMLFRCLAGRPPFEGDDGAAVLIRVIDEEAPSVSSVNAAVPRDLALIVSKCLDKDPARRYHTAAALAADLRRFRAGEPVSVRPAGAAERAVKWARRRPYLAGLSVALALSLLIGTVVSTALALWAFRQKGRADTEAAAARDAATQAEQHEREAVAEAERARQVSDALAGIFRSSDPLDIFTDGLAPPAWETQRAKTAEQLLREATDRFRGSLSGQPLARGRLLGTAGVSFRNLGLLADATPLLEESLSLLQRALPADSREIATAEVDLGRARLDLGDYPAALAHIRSAVARLNRAGADEQAVADARIFEAWALAVLGREEALTVLSDVAVIRERRGGPTDKGALIARLGTVAVLLDFGRPDDILPLAPAITAGLDALPDGQPRVITRVLFQGQAGIFLAMQAQHSSLLLKPAEDQLQATDTALAAALPARNVYRSLVRYYLADVLRRQKRFAECDQQLDECLADVRATCGLAHPKAHLAVRARAQRFLATNQPAAAAKLYDEAGAAAVARYGPASHVLALLLLDRAEFEADGKLWASAAVSARKALGMAEKLAPTRVSWHAAHDAALNLRDGPDAITHDPTLALLRLTRRLATETDGPESVGVFLAHRDEADELRNAGRHTDAAAALAASEAVLAKLPSVSALDRNLLLTYRGRLETDRGDFAAAERTYRAAAELSKGFTGKTAPYQADDLRDLAGALADQGKLAEAETTLVKALAVPGLKAKPQADLRGRLAAVRQAQGKPTVGADPRLVRAVAGGLATPAPRRSADDDYPYFDTDWLDRLPVR